MLYKKLRRGKNCQTYGSYAIFPVESIGVNSFPVARFCKHIVQTNRKFNVSAEITILLSNGIITIFTFSLLLLVYLWAESGLCHVIVYLNMLYNNLGSGRNCQTHRSYVIFPVESTDCISFPATRIFKRIVYKTVKFNGFLHITILWSHAIISMLTSSRCLLLYMRLNDQGVGNTIKRLHGQDLFKPDHWLE